MSLRPAQIAALFGAYLVFLCICQILSIGSGLLHLRTTTFGAWLILLAGALSGANTYRLLARQKSDPTDEETVPAGPRFGPWLAIFFSIFALIVTGWMWFIAYGVTDFSWDGQCYHIPTMHLWAVQGRICWVDPLFSGARFMNGYPKAVELMGYLLCLATRIDGLNNAFNQFFMPLGSLALFLLAMRMRAPAWAGLLVAAIWPCLPVMLVQGTTAYVDGSYAATVLAVMAAGIEWLWHWRRRERALPWALLTGFAMGLAVGSKGSGIIFSALAVALLLLAAFWVSWRERRGGWEAMPAVLAMLLLGLVLVGGYWPIRNTLYGGSPLYPVGVKIGKYQIFPGVSIDTALYTSIETPPLLQRLSPWKRIVHTWLQRGEPASPWPRLLGRVDARLGGLGYFWVGGCCVALIFVLLALIRRKIPPALRLPWLLLSVPTVVYFLIQPMNWWARYTVWIYVLGAPAFAVIMASAWQRPGILSWLGRLWSLLVLASLAYEAGYLLHSKYILYLDYRARYNGRNGAQGALAGEFSSKLLGEIWASPEAVAISPTGGKNRANSPRSMILGALSIPFGVRPIIPLPQDITAQECTKIAQERVRWILWNDLFGAPPPELVKMAKRTERLFGWHVLDLGTR